MIRFILIFICTWTVIEHNGQGKLPPNLFSEVSLSINKNILVDNQTIGNYGYGISVYQYINQKGVVNLIFGLEYNNLRQSVQTVGFVPRPNTPSVMYNLDYSINHLSFPLYLRVNILKLCYFRRVLLYIFIAIISK